MPPKSHTVVLTGPMACGKSLAGHYFKQLGVCVTDLDDLAHKVMHPTHACWSQLVALFPECFQDQGLDRVHLRRIVANNLGRKNLLEALIHPEVMAALTHIEVDSPYHLVISPLYHGLKAPLPKHILVLMESPECMRRQRILERPTCDPSLIKLAQSQNKQCPKPHEAAHLLINDGTAYSLEQAIKGLHRIFTERFTGTEA